MKKYYLLLLCLIIIFSFSCGGEDENEDTGSYITVTISKDNIDNEKWTGLLSSGFSLSTISTNYNCFFISPTGGARIFLELNETGGTGSYSDDSSYKECSISYNDYGGNFYYDGFIGGYSTITINRWDDRIKGSFIARIYNFSTSRIVDVSGTINSFLEL